MVVVQIATNMLRMLNILRNWENVTNPNTGNLADHEIPHNDFLDSDFTLKEAEYFG